MPCTRSSASSRAGGDRYAAINPRAAFFQAFEHQHAGGEVDPVGGQRLGEPAAAIGQGHAQRSNGTIGAFGFTQETVALAGGEVFSEPIGGVQLHAGLQGRGGGGAARPGDGPGNATNQHAGRLACTT
jgi:hypothetical protein